MKTHRTRILIAALLFGAAALTTAPAADQTATWNNSTGNWSDFTKWSTNPLFPNNGNGGFTYDAIQNGGTITLDQAITIEKFTKSGGILQGAQTLTVNDLFTFTGGELNGTVTVNANGGTLFAHSGIGELSIYGSSVLNLNSSTSWTGGRINFGNSSSLVNSVGSTFTTSFDGQMFGVTSGGSFTNNGTFTKSGGTGTTVLGDGNFLAVTNTGTINVNSGNIRLQNTTNTGTINVPVGSGLLLDITNLNAGSQITGSGTTTQIGIVTVNAAVPVSTTYNLGASTMNGNGTMNLSGPLNFTGGQTAGNVTVNANAGTTFSGTGEKSIFGTSDLNLNSNTSWTAGRINFATGSVLTNAVGSIFTTTFDGQLYGVTGGGAFVNNGTFTKSGGTGTTVLGDGNFLAVTNTGTINVNSGTIRLQNTTNTGTINVPVGSGLLLETTNLNAGGQIIGSGTTTQIGVVTVNAAVPVSTTYNLGASTMNGNGTMNLSGPLNFTGGELNGNVTLNANGGTTFSGTGDKGILGTSDLNLAGSSTWTAGRITFNTGATLSNAGTLTTNFDGEMFGVTSGGAFTNTGTFTKNGGTGTTTIGAGNAVAFSNTGTVNVTTGTLATGSGGSMPYNQSGPSSFTVLSGGAIIDTSSFNLNGGTLKGNGTVDGPLSATTANATTIAPGASPGTLTINGSTVLGSSNTLAMEVGGLAAGIDYDLLDVNGVLTLGGLLNLTFINSFQTALGTYDLFTIVTSNSAVLGSFSNVANGGFLQDTGAFHTFSVHYGASSLYNPNNVTLLALTPEPSRALLLLAGFASVLMRRRRRS